MKTNGEKMLLLMREQFARDCEIGPKVERYYDRLREVHKKQRETGVRDSGAAHEALAGVEAEYALHEKSGDEYSAEFARLRAETSPDELPSEQRYEIYALLLAMKEKDTYLFQDNEKYERSGSVVQLTRNEAAEIEERLHALEEEGNSRSPWVLYAVRLSDKEEIEDRIAHCEEARRYRAWTATLGPEEYDAVTGKDDRHGTSA